MNTKDIIRIRQHTAWNEPPDIFVTHWRGEITAGDMLAMYDELEKFASLQPHVYSLTIAMDVTALGAEARKLTATDPRTQYFVAMAVVGASFHLRVLTTMLMKATAVISRHRVTPMIFCDTEDEGRAWLAVKRQEFAVSSQ